MASWLDSMSDLMGGYLSDAGAGGGVADIAGAVASATPMGAVANIGSSLLSSMSGGTDESKSSSSGTLGTGDWNVSLGSSNTTLLIIAAIAAFLIFKKR